MAYAELFSSLYHTVLNFWRSFSFLTTRSLMEDRSPGGSIGSSQFRILRVTDNMNSSETDPKTQDFIASLSN